MLVPALDRKSAEYLDFCEESDAEKMRQFYVALTRAKERLYIPLVIDSSKGAVEKGTASPMELYLAQLGQGKLSYFELYERVGLNEKGSLERLVKSNDDLVITEIDEGVAVHVKPLDKVALKLEPPPHVEVPKSNKRVFSFTTLASKAPLPPPPQLGLMDPLPSGSEVGTELHALFEKIRWERLGKMTSPEDIPFLLDRDDLKLSPVLEGHEERVKELLYNTFATPLLGTGSFSLKEVSPEKQWREMEFLYPLEGVEEECAPSGYLKGFIDLIFAHEGKFYIVDWKSNLLDSYDETSLEEAMNQHKYHLQAKIYTEALERYLALIGEKSFAEVFGGVFYLFIRGMKRGKEGIYHFFPKGASLWKD